MIIIVKLNHRLCIIFTAHHMISLELHMHYVYYMNSIDFLNPLYVDFKSQYISSSS